MKRLTLLRHTVTALNKTPVRLRGGLDVPLAPEGFAQIPVVVEAIKKAYPDVRKVYSSPLNRAASLATAIAHEYGLQVQKLDQLTSYNYGVLNGRPVSEVLDVLKTLTSGHGRELAPKGGESFNDFLVRLTDGVKQIIAEAPEEGQVIVCSHLQNLMLAKAYLEAGLPDDVRNMPYEYKESNEIEPGNWVELRRVWTV